MAYLEYLITFSVILSLAIQFSKAQRKDAYSYQGAEVRVWNDFKPAFEFKNHPAQRGPPVYQPYPYVPLIQKDPAIYSYPAYDSEDFDYDYRNFQNLPPVHKKPMEVVNVTAERMGGFGGNGDTRGYGAYDYKKSEDETYDQQKLDNKPYKTKAKKGKKQKEAYTYIDPNGDYYGGNHDGRYSGLNSDKDSSISYGSVEDVADRFKFNNEQKPRVNEPYVERYKVQENEPYKPKKSRTYLYKTNKKHEYRKTAPQEFKTSKKHQYPKSEPYNYKTNDQYKYEDQEVMDPFRYMDDMFVGMNFDDFFRLPKDRKDGYDDRP